jgi:hypothetical protein
MVSFTGKAIGHAPTAIERFFPILNKGELPGYGAAKGNCLTLQDQQRVRSTYTFL